MYFWRVSRILCPGGCHFDYICHSKELVQAALPVFSLAFRQRRHGGGWRVRGGGYEACAVTEWCLLDAGR